MPWRPRVATSGSECNVLCLFDVWAQNGRMIFQTISRSTPWGPRTRTKTSRRGLMVNLVVFGFFLTQSLLLSEDPKNPLCQRFRWTQTLPPAAEEREGQTPAAPPGASRGQHRGTARTVSLELRARTSSSSSVSEAALFTSPASTTTWSPRRSSGSTPARGKPSSTPSCAGACLRRTPSTLTGWFETCEERASASSGRAPTCAAGLVEWTILIS